MKTLAIAAAVSAALASSTALADVISFDTNGTAAGGVINGVAVFDWLPGNTVAQNVIPLIATNNGTADYQVYAHGRLGTFTDGIAAIGLMPGGQEMTFVFGFGEKGTANSATSVTFADPTNPANFENFFEIWVGAANSDPAAGTGYRDGTKILTGALCASGSCGAGVPGIVSGSYSLGTQPTILPPLDSFGTQNTVYGSTPTVVGSGATDLNIKVLTQDFDWFLTSLDTLSIGLVYNTSQVTPYNQTDPSAQFNTLGGLFNPNIGPVNGQFPGPDFMFQTDANNAFRTVPEPASTMLLGLSLVGLALTRKFNKRG